jgi:hypothetical protein
MNEPEDCSNKLSLLYQRIRHALKQHNTRVLTQILTKYTQPEVRNMVVMLCFSEKGISFDTIDFLETGGAFAPFDFNQALDAARCTLRLHKLHFKHNHIMSSYRKQQQKDDSREPVMELPQLD